MVSPCYALLLIADPIASITCTLSTVIPHGLAWVFIGLVIMGAVMKITKSYSIAGVIFVLYLGLLIPANLVSVAVQPFLALVIALFVGVLIWKTLK